MGGVSKARRISYSILDLAERPRRIAAELTVQGTPRTPTGLLPSGAPPERSRNIPGRPVSATRPRGQSGMANLDRHRHGATTCHVWCCPEMRVYATVASESGDEVSRWDGFQSQ
jgi:hypothetical protein